MATNNYKSNLWIEKDCMVCYKNKDGQESFVDVNSFRPLPNMVLSKDKKYEAELNFVQEEICDIRSCEQREILNSFSIRNVVFVNIR